VAFANITFVETQLRSGRPPVPAMAPQLPVILGNGVGGVVSSVRPGADPALTGRRVITTTGGSGGYAERVAVDAAGLIPVPEPGASVAVDYSAPGWAERVRRQAGRVDVVFDGVGGEIAAAASACSPAAGGSAPSAWPAARLPGSRTTKPTAAASRSSAGLR
jgi:NADPH:quinone reductase